MNKKFGIFILKKRGFAIEDEEMYEMYERVK